MAGAGPGSGFVAVDLGASSGRVILGRVGPEQLELTELHRFRNGPVRLPDGLHWDILGLYLDVLTGLRAAAAAGGVRGVAVDSWAVDYGLLDRSGALLGNPFHYRDSRTDAAVRTVRERISSPELYLATGIQHLPFNTVFQLAAEGDRLDAAARLLLIPDLIGYWLSGATVAEQTNASTTALLDARTGEWSAGVLAAVGIPAGLLPPVVAPGTVVGGLRAAVCEGTGLAGDVQLIAVGSHDTASAVAGVPAETPDFAYISCGTWGLVGVELTEPILTTVAQEANFTNERGVDDTVRFLRNVMGLWLLQECLRAWQVRGLAAELSELLAVAGSLPRGGPVIDPNRPEFLAPGDMPARIAAECARTGQPVPQGQAATVRCILDSLAAAFASTVREAVELAGRHVSVVHLVGGGSQNDLLCQLTADALDLPVVAGPVEASAIGSLVVQARTLGAVSGTLWDLRALVRRTHETRTFRPAHGSI